MQFDQMIRHKRYTLLMAALLLLSNAMVTAHAFGTTEHVAKDSCQMLHQVERQPVVSAGVPVPPADIRGYALPEARMPVAVDIAVLQYFHSRAPPLA